MQQSGNNAKSFAFKTALAKLCSDFVNNLTWKLLLTKCKQGLFTDEIAGFNNAIWLYGTCAAVNKYNIIWLYDFLQPVIVIKSIDTGVSIWKIIFNQCVSQNPTAGASIGEPRALAYTSRTAYVSYT